MTIPRNLSFLAEGASSTGVLNPTNGGTGLTTLTVGYIPYGNGTGAFNSSSNLFYDGTNNRLGIGTNAPGQPLVVSKNYNGSTWTQITNTTAGTGSATGVLLTTDSSIQGTLELDSLSHSSFPGMLRLRNIGAYPLGFFTNDTERMRIDSSGNLGLGVTPSAWTTSSTAKAFEVGTVGNALYGFSGSNINLTSGAYYNSGWKYAISAVAVTYYNQSSGVHAWFTAPSGTAGNAITFTQAMQIANSGGVSIGNTTDPGAGNLSVTGNVTAYNLQGPAFSAYQSASSQAITNASFTKVVLDATEFNINSNFDNTTNYRFTPTVAGYYQVSGHCTFGTGATTSEALITIYKNGVRFKDGLDYSPVSGYGFLVSALIYFNGSTDYVELYVYQSSGGNKSLSNNAYSTYFQAVMVRSA